MSKEPQSTWNWEKWHRAPFIVIGAAAFITFEHFAVTQRSLILFGLLEGLVTVTLLLTMFQVIVVKTEIVSRKEKEREAKPQTSR